MTKKKYKKEFAEYVKQRKIDAEHEIFTAIQGFEVASGRKCVGLKLITTFPVTALGEEVLINVELILSND